MLVVIVAVCLAQSRIVTCTHSFLGFLPLSLALQPLTPPFASFWGFTISTADDQDTVLGGWKPMSKAQQLLTEQGATGTNWIVHTPVWWVPHKRHHNIERATLHVAPAHAFVARFLCLFFLLLIVAVHSQLSLEGGAAHVAVLSQRQGCKSVR